MNVPALMMIHASQPRRKFSCIEPSRGRENEKQIFWRGQNDMVIKKQKAP